MVIIKSFYPLSKDYQKPLSRTVCQQMCETKKRHSCFKGLSTDDICVFCMLQNPKPLKLESLHNPVMYYIGTYSSPLDEKLSILKMVGNVLTKPHALFLIQYFDKEIPYLSINSESNSYTYIFCRPNRNLLQF